MEVSVIVQLLSLRGRGLTVPVAVTPDVAAQSLVDFVNNDFGMDKTGEYWAPRGPADIGTSDETMGKNLPTPLRLPY